MQTRSSLKLTRDQTSNPASSTNTTLKGRTHRSSKQKVENSNFEEHLPSVTTMADNRTMAEMALENQLLSVSLFICLRKHDYVERIPSVKGCKRRESNFGAAAGERTRVTRVTGGNTYHYTTKISRDQTSNSTSSTNTTPKGHTRRSSKQKVEISNFEEHLPPVATMADNRTMDEMLRAPTEGCAKAIVVPPILAEQFELKHSLINMMTSEQFFGLETVNPHDHIRAARRWLEKEPSHQDSLNAAAGGNLLEKSPQDALTIIENKSKVRNSQSKPIASPVNACDINSSSEIAKLSHAVNQQTSDVTTAMMTMLKQLQATPPPASVKAVEEICVTYGDSSLQDSIDQTDLANLDDYFVDPTPEMFTDEHTLDYSFPPIFDVYDDDFLEVESDADNEKKLTISKASLVFEDFDPPFYEPLVFKDVPNLKMLLLFSSENKKKVFKPGIYTSGKVKEKQENDKIGTKPNKNRKRGKARQCRRPITVEKAEKRRKYKFKGQNMQILQSVFIQVKDKG
uniref:Reverse transcriptase domain-containing protein n=1 Tax=Tanacetum cinerariifolium TaxID=118510 RepID=A0A6L2MD33_TANCI|nr:hypothetical protein [Tanacetum cinerariifolium]